MFKGPEALEMIDRYVEPAVLETVWSEDHMESSKGEPETWRELSHRRPAVRVRGSNAAILGNWDGMAKITVAGWVETHMTYNIICYLFTIYSIYLVLRQSFVM